MIVFLNLIYLNYEGARESWGRSKITPRFLGEGVKDFVTVKTKEICIHGKFRFFS